MSEHIIGLKRRVFKSHFMRSIFLLAGGTAIGQLLVLLAAPILTRLYTAEEFGIFGLFTTYFIIAATVVTGQYQLAIVSAPSQRDAAYLAGLSVLILIPMTLIAVAVLFLMKAQAWLGYGAFSIGGIWILAATLIAHSAFIVCRYWLTRAEAFGVISRILPLQQCGRAVGQVALGFAGIGWLGLALGEVFGRLVGMGRAIRVSWPAILQHLLPLRWSDFARVAYANKSYPMLTVPSSLLDQLGMLLPLPLIAHFYGLEPAGYFALVQRVLSLPSAIIGQSVADVFHARIAKLKAGQRAAATKLTIQTAALLFIGAIGPTAIVVLTGPWLFSTIFGEAWSEAGRLAAVLIFWHMANFVVSPLSRIVFVFDGQRLKFMYDLITLGLTIGAFVWANMSGASLIALAVMLSVANALSYVVYLGLLILIINRSAEKSAE